MSLQLLQIDKEKNPIIAKLRILREILCWRKFHKIFLYNFLKHGKQQEERKFECVMVPQPKKWKVSHVNEIVQQIKFSQQLNSFKDSKNGNFMEKKSRWIENQDTPLFTTFHSGRQWWKLEMSWIFMDLSLAS